MGLWNRIVQKMSKQTFKMVQERGNGFYAWNGRLYHSDVVRACIRPKTKAILKVCLLIFCTILFHKPIFSPP